MRTARTWGGLVVVMLVSTTTACDAPKSTSTTGTPSASATTGTVSPAATTGTVSPAPAEPSSVAAQHVLIAYKGADAAPKAVTRTKADAKKRADEVATKARSGADFSALVAEYSDDPAAKERAGSVGKFTREKMARPFSEAAFALTVGATSEPVETKYGFHVIKRNQ